MAALAFATFGRFIDSAQDKIESNEDHGDKQNRLALIGFYDVFDAVHAVVPFALLLLFPFVA